ncbi:MAG: NrsF family protein [Novosphingobium sp.]
MPRNTDILIAGLVDELKPVAPLRPRRGMTLALAGLLAGCLATLWIIGMRPDFRAMEPEALPLTGALLFLVLALASAWGAVDMARPYVGLRREGWGWTASMAGVLPLAALVVLLGEWLRGGNVGALVNGSVCMACGLLLSLITGAALTLWLRRGAPPNPARAGLLVGVAAGASGIFAVSLACPHNDLVHIGLWHGMTVVLAGIAGRLVVPRLIAW